MSDTSGFVSFHTRGAAAAFIEMVNTADNKPGLAAVTACFAKVWRHSVSYGVSLICVQTPGNIHWQDGESC